jgi:hypothetical protein
MSESGKEHPFWGVIGKATAVCGLIGLVYAGYSKVTAPSAALGATIDRGAFYLPPRYSEFPEKIRAVLSPEQLEKTIQSLDGEQASSKSDKDDSSSPLIRRWSAFSLSRALLDQSQALEASSGHTYGGYWEAEVVNAGVPVEKVTLRLPGTEIAVVNREDGTNSTHNKGPVIDLGNLRASENVKVIAWTSIPPHEEPSIYHSQGPGSLTLKYRFTLGGWIMDNFGSFLLGFMGLYLLLAVGYAMHRERAIKKKYQTASPSNPTPP